MNWDARQYSKEEKERISNAERQKRYRERYSNALSNVTDNVTITQDSVSVSVSDSESLIKDSLTKKTFFMINDAEKALIDVTGFYPLPSTYTPLLEKVLDLLQHNGRDDTVERLTKAKDNWVSQKRSVNGANYKLTNPAWIDYAITGETVGVKVLTEQERIHQELAELAKKTEYQG
jgi:hypothetical protein